MNTLHIISMEYAAGRSALYMMKADDIQFRRQQCKSDIVIIGNVLVYDKKSRTATTSNGAQYTVFSDWSVRQQ